MIVVDAGPMIALLDRSDPDHLTCVRVTQEVDAQLATTWPAFTEAMHYLGDRIGWPAQAALWRLVEQGQIILHNLSEGAVRRARELMQKYRDLPMDLDDASLVALAELLDEPRVFTLDRDFAVYRLHGRRRFQILPSR